MLPRLPRLSSLLRQKMSESRAEANSIRPLRPPTLESNILFVAKGGGITFAGKMFLSATRLVTAVLLARLLGAEQYGLYSLALSASGIAVGLAVFGLDSALVRYVAILAGRQDEKGVWGALQIGIGVATLLSVLTGTLLFALAYPIAERFFHGPQMAPLLQLVGVIVPMLVLSELLAGAHRGFRRMDYPAVAQSVAQPIIRLLLIVVLAFSGFNAALAILTYGLADLAASFILLYFLNKEFRLRRPWRDGRRDTREMLSFSLPVWLSGLMYTFHGNLQTLLLGSLSTIAGAGVFSVASQVTTIGSQFSSSLNISAKPVMAELHDRGDFGQMERIYQTSNKWAVMVQLPIFLGMVLFPAQILAVFGESFSDGATALVIMAWASLLLVGTGMGGIIIDMAGYMKLKMINSVFRLVLFLGLDLLLIPRWGLTGAAVAALVGEGAINLLRMGQVYWLFRILPYNWSFVKPLAAAVLAFVTVWILRVWLPPDVSLLYTIVNTVAMLTVYAGATLLIGLSPQEREMYSLARQKMVTRIGRR